MGFGINWPRAAAVGFPRGRWHPGPALVVSLLVTASCVTVQVPQDPAGAPCALEGGQSWPVRGAFYYPWFPEKWRDMRHGLNAAARAGLHPDFNGDGRPDAYSCDEAEVIDRQIAAMQWGNIQVGIVSWWGIGTVEDRRMPLLLERGRLASFKWCVYYEGEGRNDPSPLTLAADLTHILESYALHPAYADAYFRVCGRPVVFVYNPRDRYQVARRWREACDRVEQSSGVRPFVVLHEIPGYRSCGECRQFSWHRYAPGQGQGAYQLGGYSFTVRPGFTSVDRKKVQRRNLKRWERDVAAMRRSPTAWNLVTSFNEWLEGSAVEPAAEWRSQSGFGAYLDVLHRLP